MTEVRYVGPHDAIELTFVDDTGRTMVVDDVAYGDTVEVPAAVAGRAAAGVLGEDGFDPGEGLLAQSDNWVPASVPTPPLPTYPDSDVDAAPAPADPEPTPTADEATFDDPWEA